MNCARRSLTCCEWPNFLTKKRIRCGQCKSKVNELWPMKSSAGGSGVEEDETLPRMNQRYVERMEECGTNTETKRNKKLRSILQPRPAPGVILPILIHDACDWCSGLLKYHFHAACRLLLTHQPQSISYFLRIETSSGGACLWIFPL